MTIRNQSYLDERAKTLRNDPNLNGIDFVLVSLTYDNNNKPVSATLEVHFLNNNYLTNFTDSKKIKDLKTVFKISGGHRIHGGDCLGQVQVTNVSSGDTTDDDKVLNLTVEPIGDYSTYTLSIDYDNKIDPRFNDINFKFRPDCFNMNCSPEWKSADKPESEPVIDYLAKDFDSFKHVMVSAMMERVLGWQPTSEANLDVVLLELFSATADELSDYQDRVMAEAYLNTSRKRVSLARHARLMDYYIYQGNQAYTWLAMNVFLNDKPHTIPVTVPPEVFTLNEGFQIWPENYEDSYLTFISKEDQIMHPLLNDLSLYTWSDSLPTLKAGDTSADLYVVENNIKADYEFLAYLINNGSENNIKIKYLLIEELLNPETGNEADRDPNKRQLLKLKENGNAAEVQSDPLTGQYFIKICWEEKDKLKSNYCFSKYFNGEKKIISSFCGNLVEVFHGFPIETVFKKEETVLSNDKEYYYEETKWGTICRLPDVPPDFKNNLSGENIPLAFKDTLSGGDIPPASTLVVKVSSPSSSNEEWTEQASLIHSTGADQHFLVEIDEQGRGTIRFGDGINGRRLPDDATVTCQYQVGNGLDGNIGADKLTNFQPRNLPIIKCWNPFNITNGRSQEPVEEIIRRVPEAYRLKQLRAVTIDDYIRMVEQIPGISKASARYMWTGSWRTVQVTFDSLSTTSYDDLEPIVARRLDAVRMIGEDIEIRPPRFVPLEINVKFCVHPDYWQQDVKKLVEQEFSDGFTSDGGMGFFHQDLWTFGQVLYSSQIMGRVQSVEGVDYVMEVTMTRWNEPTPGDGTSITVRPNEIIQVKNDPDHNEKGFIKFTTQGGRQ